MSFDNCNFFCCCQCFFLRFFLFAKDRNFSSKYFCFKNKAAFTISFILSKVIKDSRFVWSLDACLNYSLQFTQKNCIWFFLYNQTRLLFQAFFSGMSTPGGPGTAFSIFGPKCWPPGTWMGGWVRGPQGPGKFLRPFLWEWVNFGPGWVKIPVMGGWAGRPGPRSACVGPPPSQ